MKNISTKAKRISEKLFSLILSKKSFIAFSLTLFIQILINPAGSSAQKCSFSLVAKNNIESVNNEGRVYFMELQNNSTQETEITLTVANVNSGTNPDQSTAINNVNLSAEILYEDGQKINGKVVLKSNELLHFQVKVTVPEGTPFDHWNNLAVNASSDTCDAFPSSLTLFTFVPNPEER
jgi:hypothetical protein